MNSGFFFLTENKEGGPAVIFLLIKEKKRKTYRDLKRGLN